MSDAQRRVDIISRAIESEIIPRLMHAHRHSKPDGLTPSGGHPAVTQTEIESFTALAMEPASVGVQRMLDAMHARGIRPGKLYLQLLTPTARRLGELWEQDLCSFSDVTIGLGTLQQVLRDLRRLPDKDIDKPWKGLRILLAPCPGEQHSYGIAMVGEFFRRAGWHVEGGPGAADPAALVSLHEFDAVGLSMAADIFQTEMAKCIAAIRRNSLNQNLIVMVGGPAFLANPGLVSELRADAMATDGQAAPDLVESMLRKRRTGDFYGAKV